MPYAEDALVIAYALGVLTIPVIQYWVFPMLWKWVKGEWEEIKGEKKTKKKRKKKKKNNKTKRLIKEVTRTYEVEEEE